MALTYRSVKGSALTIQELDDNFRHFTSSQNITGSITADSFSGSFSGSFKGDGSNLTGITIDQSFTNITASGAISASGDLTVRDGRFTRGTAEIEIIGDTTGIIGTQTNHNLLLRRNNIEKLRIEETRTYSSQPLTVTGSILVSGSTAHNPHINVMGNISASGNVITEKVGIINGAGIGFGANFISGNESADVEIFTDADGEINFTKNNIGVLSILSGNEILINPVYSLKEPLKVTNSITATSITSSGAISASGDITGVTGSFGGGLVLTSPNGTKYRFITNDSGHLSLTGSAV